MGKGNIPPDIPGFSIPYQEGEAVLNGTTDFSSVQDAVDHASEGDTILIGPGTFSAVLVETADLTFIGSGPGTIIDGGSNGVAFDINANNVTVIQVSARTDTGVAGQNLYPFRVRNNISGVVLQLCRVIDGDDNAFRIIGDETKLIGCVVEANDGQGFNFTGSSRGCAAIGCVVQSGVSSIGIRLDGERGAAIGCSVTGVGSTGIDVNDPSATVDGNVIDSTFGDGIAVRSESTNAIVMANVVTNWDTGNNGNVAIDTTDAPAGAILIGNNPPGENNADATTYKGNDIDTNGDGTVDEADDLTDAGWVARLVDSPNGQIPNAALDNGDSAEISVPVADGETLKVYRWGAYQISDGTTPADLDVELLDGSDTVQATENTGDNESTDPGTPVASHTNSSGSTSIFKLAVANDTGGAIADPGVGAFFAYLVE